jgi:hypothetical protein
MCYVLSLLRIHSPDCEHCMAHLTCGNELRKRLEELNRRTQPFSPIPEGPSRPQTGQGRPIPARYGDVLSLGSPVTPPVHGGFWY